MDEFTNLRGNHMKIIFTSLLALGLPAAALAQTNSSSLSAQDRSFVIIAAASGIAEVQEGQLAAAKGDSAVKAIGNRMIADHGKANDILSSIAANKAITPPTQVTSSQAAALAQLQGLSGKLFDAAYLKDQRAAHETAIKLFETEASSGTDADLKGFAAKTLPTLKMHRQMIKAAE
jgi:putative membrane protein